MDRHTAETYRRWVEQSNTGARGETGSVHVYVWGYFTTRQRVGLALCFVFGVEKDVDVFCIAWRRVRVRRRMTGNALSIAWRARISPRQFSAYSLLLLLWSIFGFCYTDASSSSHHILEIFIQFPLWWYTYTSRALTLIETLAQNYNEGSMQTDGIRIILMTSTNILKILYFSTNKFHYV